MSLTDRMAALAAEIAALPLAERVAALNEVRVALQAASPFAAEPVDCVQWVLAETVTPNDYNPNSVAPPEMRLLERSIQEDGYTQPVVAWRAEQGYEVVDGFHRTRVGRESAVVRARTLGYLPIAVVNTAREDRGDRMAATVRHNRARGKHSVEGMSDIVIALKRRMWSNEKIGKELGMEQDEVLRLTQVNGLAAQFADKEFSRAWESTGL